MKSRGFSLLELTTVLFIALILVTMGIPSYSQWANENRAKASLQQLRQALQYAKMQSLTTGKVMLLCKSLDGEHCAVVMGGQLLVAAESAGQQELLRVFPALSERARLAWKKFPDGKINQPIYFYPMMNFNQNGRVVYCDQKTDFQPIYGFVRSKQGHIRDVVLHGDGASQDHDEELMTLYRICRND